MWVAVTSSCCFFFFFTFCQDYSIDEEAALQAALALSLAENWQQSHHHHPLTNSTITAWLLSLRGSANRHKIQTLETASVHICHVDHHSMKGYLHGKMSLCVSLKDPEASWLQKPHRGAQVSDHWPLCLDFLNAVTHWEQLGRWSVWELASRDTGCSLFCRVVWSDSNSFFCWVHIQ